MVRICPSLQQFRSVYVQLFRDAVSTHGRPCAGKRSFIWVPRIRSTQFHFETGEAPFPIWIPSEKINYISRGMFRFGSRVSGRALRRQSNLEFPIACDSVPQSAHYVREVSDFPW